MRADGGLALQIEVGNGQDDEINLTLIFQFTGVNGVLAGFPLAITM